MLAGRRTGRREIDWTEEAVSDALAAHAQHEQDQGLGVRKFRSEALPSGLLALSEVPAWLRAQADREAAAVANRPRAAIGPSTKLSTLSYAIGGSRSTFRIVVRRGGTLDRMRAIATKLGAFYGWDEAQATTFVVTGIVPLVSAIRARVSVSSPLLVRSRITLTIAPSTTPREVADYYRRVRREKFGRIRRPAERHAMLGAFAAGLSPDLDHVQQMKRWNLQCAQWKKTSWKFKHPSRFAREAQRAINRLVEFGHH